MLESHLIGASAADQSTQIILSGHDAVDRSFTHMTKGCVANIMGQCNGIHQIQVDQRSVQCGIDLATDTACNYLDLDGVSQSGSDLSFRSGVKQLGLVLHITKLQRIYDFFYVRIIDFRVWHILPPKNVRFLHRTTIYYIKSTIIM